MQHAISRVIAFDIRARCCARSGLRRRARADANAYFDTATYPHTDSNAYPDTATSSHTDANSVRTVAPSVRLRSASAT